MPYPLFATVTYREKVRTDTSGQFTLDTLIDGQYLLWAHAGGYSEEGRGPVVVPTTDRQDLVLFHGGAVEGEVTDPEGRPVEDAIIWCGLRDWLGIASVAYTDAGGHYRVEHARVGPLSLMVNESLGQSSGSRGAG